MTGVAVLLAVCLSWMCAFMDDWTLLFTCIAIVRLVPAVIARGLTQPQTAASQPVPTDAVGYHSCIDAVWTTSLCDGRDEGTHRSCCWEGCIFTLSCFPRQHRKLIGEALALPRGLEIEGPSYYLGSGDLVFYSGEGAGTRGTLKRAAHLGVLDAAVIVARAASRGTASFAAAFICVIMGFVLTVGVTAAGQDAAVPALPFSVCGGVAGMLFTWWLTQPYIDGLVQFQLSTYGASTA